MQNVRTWGVVAAAILGTFVIVLAVLLLWPDDNDDDSPMGAMGTTDFGEAMAPPVEGFYDGEEILFIHTEASEPQVVEMLTGMMGSPVIHVPALAAVSEETLAIVYVFTNGVVSDGALGPMGFQPDVFDSAPGDEGYSPLRAVHLVTWEDEAQATLLTSAGEVVEAEQRGELAIEPAGVVVNMPFLTWPGGQR